MNPRKSLLHDQRGAMMVIAVFMAVFLVGCLWYLIGVGDAAVYRERMQDGSDSVAYASAVYHARGMNLLVVMNIVMAALLAILVALKLLVLLLTIAFAILTALCAVPFCQAACGIAAGVNTMRNTLSNLTEQYENDFCNPVIEALSAAQIVIAEVTPFAANAAATAGYATSYAPTVKGGVALSVSMVPSDGRLGLPVQEGSFDELCAKAIDNVGDLMEAVMPPGVGTFAGGLVESMVSTYPSYFCGDSGSSGSESAIDDDLCEDQEKKHDQEEKAWKSWCTDEGYAEAICPSDARPLGGPLRPGDFDMDRCELQMLTAKMDTMGNDGGGQEDQTNKTPKNVYEKAKNGSDYFAVYGAVWGDRARLEKSDRIVRLPSWDDPKAAEAASSASAARAEAVSLSKAEFYFDGMGDWKSLRDDAMWTLAWRARLRRFRMPETSEGGGLEGWASVAGAVADFSGVVDGGYFTTLAKSEREGDPGKVIADYEQAGGEPIIH